MAECKLLAHLVAGFPDDAGARRLALALARGGADALEAQFPFSDPTADGPAIERASHTALSGGFTVDGGFRLVGELTRDPGMPPVYIMTYAALVVARGVRRFAGDARAAGARGLIIPDLPVDADEGLWDAGRAEGLEIVPVLAPGISDARLRLVRARKPAAVYTALRQGVTGAATELDEATLAYLKRLAGLGTRVWAGFGVRRPEQARALAGHVYGVAAGTCFLEAMEEARRAKRDPYRAAGRLCAELRGVKAGFFNELLSSRT